jgi:hypothetical protein
LVKNVTRQPRAVKFHPLGCPCVLISMDGVDFPFDSPCGFGLSKNR